VNRIQGIWEIEGVFDLSGPPPRRPEEFVSTGQTHKKFVRRR